MGKIEKRAFLSVEDDTGAAFVVFSDGTRSTPFFSREEAREEVLYALASGKIDEAEERHLRESISDWQSPETEATGILILAVERRIAENEELFRDCLERLDDEEVVH